MTGQSADATERTKSEIVDDLASRIGVEDTGDTSPRSPTLRRAARELDVNGPYGGAGATREKLRARMGREASDRPLTKDELVELLNLIDEERNGWYVDTDIDHEDDQ